MDKHYEKPTQFGDAVTGDHFFSREPHDKIDHEDPWYPGAWTAVMLYDRATDWRAAYPSGTKTAKDTKAAFRDFAGNTIVKSFYAGNS